MKIVKKNVYYCDFCKKKGLRSLKKHEANCTGNPNRNCGICGRTDISDLIQKYSNRYTGMDGTADDNGEIKWTNGAIKIEDIQDDVEGCPACTLAILRLCDLNHWYVRDAGLKFDFKSALEEWWEEENAEHIGDYSY